MAKRTLQERISDADAKCAMWLNRGNEMGERGKSAQSERCYEKAQSWLDTANDLRDRQLHAQISHCMTYFRPARTA